MLELLGGLNLHQHLSSYRDESFIISWGGGGRLYSGGVGNFFGDVLGGGELKILKMTYGQGGSCISSGIGRVRCVPLVFLFIKSHSFWGRSTPDPPTSQLYNVRLSEPLERHWK